MGSLRALLALCVLALAFSAVAADPEYQTPTFLEDGADMMQEPAGAAAAAAAAAAAPTTLDENGQDAYGTVGLSTELLSDPWANDASLAVATDEPNLVAELDAARPPIVATTVVRSSATSPCGARKGTCKMQSAGCAGTFQPGLCTGAAGMQCCLSSAVPAAPATVPTASCGPYQTATKMSIKGNAGKTFNVVKIAKEHMTDPSKHALAPDVTDNTMTTTTACAFNTMLAAAKAAGHKITINCGFRTYGRQKYFWDCYKSKKCNSGSLAAQPGTSPHGVGVALDLQLTTAAYKWMSENAHNFGFVRTVPSETWHWEHRPGHRRAPYT